LGKKLAFSFNVSRCSGCFACVVACQDQHDHDSEISFRYVGCYEKGSHPTSSVAFSSIACFHCGDAPCINICPTGALAAQESDGVVKLNRDLCIGCHSCMLACPFGAPRFMEDGLMAKCDLCYSRIDQGLEPACVHTCTTKALGFGLVNKLAEGKAISASINLIDNG
jgi:anaerobic dimethyl sulfoxide reductase subunit B